MRTVEKRQKEFNFSRMRRDLIQMRSQLEEELGTLNLNSRKFKVPEPIPKEPENPFDIHAGTQYETTSETIFKTPPPSVLETYRNETPRKIAIKIRQAGILINFIDEGCPNIPNLQRSYTRLIYDYMDSAILGSHRSKLVREYDFEKHRVHKEFMGFISKYESFPNKIRNFFKRKGR